MSQLTQAAARWYVHCFQVLRTEGFYDRGIYRKVKSETFFCKGNLQPASQAQVDRLPEGARRDGALTMYTKAQLRTADSPNTVADRVLYNGVEYEISGFEHWTSHSEYTLTKVAQ